MNSTKGFNGRWWILAISYLNIVAFALVFLSLSPVLHLIIADVGLTHGEAGALMSFFALPGILFSIPAGILADRFGSRSVGLVSLLLMTIGSVLTAAGQSFPALAAGRAIAGTGAFTLTIALTHLISVWFKGKELGFALGVYNTGVPVGTILTLNTLGLIGRKYGWQFSLSLTAAASLTALLGFLFIAKAPAPDGAYRSEAVPSVSHDGRTSRSGAGIWFVGLAWLWSNAAGISYLTFGTDFFISRGQSAATAGLLTSFLMIGSLFLSPAIGYMLDRGWSQKKMIMIGSGCMSMLYVMIPLIPSPVYMFTVLLGAVAALIPVSIFSLPPRILPLQKVGIGFGIISACLNVGILIGPCAVGIARDIFGGYHVGFILMAGFGIMALVSIALLRVNDGRPRS